MSRDDHEARVVLMINEVEGLVRLEHLRTALEHAEVAVEAAATLSAPVCAAALHARARARDALGDLDGAEADVLAAAELEADVPARWMFGAQLAASRKDWETARERFQRAIAVGEAVGERSAEPQARWELAHIALVSGNDDGARRELEAALASAEELADVETTSYCEIALADLDAEQGNRDAARRRYARVRALRDQLAPSPRQVIAEPVATAAEPAAVQPAEMPAPPDGEPVLRIVLSPAFVEQAVVELWAADGTLARRVLVPFRVAVAPSTLQRLRWYTEEYAARPLDPGPAIAAEVEQELEQLGETLFDALLGPANAAPIAEAVRQSLERLRVEVVADAVAADALPWELLRDPENATDIALGGRGFTRTTTAALTAAPATRHGGAMRIMLVISRPEGRLDIGFRSVADPLLRELAASGAAVSVDVLRPPTFERLRDVVLAAGAGGQPYDLVHFDGHGVVEDGRGGLVFENGDVSGTLVSGEEIGRALQEGDVPLLVMNACRSASGEAYGSVARAALEEGLAAVLAMRFNVYVPTAALFMGGLYGALGEGGDLLSAVTHARRLLAERPERAGMPVVRDWCVPALYQAAPVRLATGAATINRAGDAYADALPPPPSHGFVGRDEVFVELEAALVDSPHAVLRALGGAGKTTLAIEFARWYARTGGGELDLWDDLRSLDDLDHRQLDQIAAAGGRVLLLTDRVRETGDLPLVPMPNFPSDEAYALAMAVAAEARANLSPDAAAKLVSGLRGHALAIVLAVRELARRDTDIGLEHVAPILEELSNPTNGSPASWTRALDGLELEGLVDAAVVAAQFRGYVSVFGFGALAGMDDDFDAAEAALGTLTARGMLTQINPLIYAIHPGLAVALASAGRFQAPGRSFAEAMAETAAGWGALAEQQGFVAPWPAEIENIVFARRLASRAGWWPLVVDLMNGINAAGLHGEMPNVWRDAVLDAAPDFVDMATGEPVPGMEAHGPVFLAHLASIADMEGDDKLVIRLRTTDVRRRRDEADGALAVAPDHRSDEQHGLVRRLAVGLTNLGSAQRDAGQRDARETLEEAAALACEIGDWRLEALNRLNLGVYWMVVPSPMEFARADTELAAGYNLAIADDPPLAGKLMTERGTVLYERGMATNDPAAAEACFQQAANHLELAVDLRESDAVLFHQLGQVHRQLGNYDDARVWFEQAIEIRENELAPGAGADARLHLAQTLDEAGLVAEALAYARSAEAVLVEADQPDPALQFEVEQTIARLALRAGAMPRVAARAVPAAEPVPPDREAGEAGLRRHLRRAARAVVARRHSRRD